MLVRPLSFRCNPLQGTTTGQ